MSLETVLADIDSANHLSLVTRQMRKSQIRVLFRTKPFPKKIVTKVLPQLSVKDSTMLNYLGAILGVMRVSPAFRNIVGEHQRKTLLQEFVILKEKETQRVQAAGARETDIKWEDLLACEEKFPEGSEALLIHKLYTHLPTVRSDFTPVKIVDTLAETADTNMNYFVMDDPDTPPVFILNVYKTSNRYGQQIFPLPQSILDMVPKNQTFLFEAAPGFPIFANTLSKKVTRAYKRYCGIHVNINIIRRSYAEHTRGDAVSAINQGHSLGTHAKYAARD